MALEAGHSTAHEQLSQLVWHKGSDTDFIDGNIKIYEQWLTRLNETSSARQQCIQFGSFEAQAAHHLASSLTQERDTWRLLAALHRCEERHRDVPDVPETQGVEVVGGFLNEKAVLEQAQRNDFELDKDKTVTAWLEELEWPKWQALHPRLDRVQAATMPRTLRLLQTGRHAAGLVDAMDPDAAQRQTAGEVPLPGAAKGAARALHPDDLAEEEQLLEGVWCLLRAGRLDAAIELCRDFAQPWRAASLGGGRAWDDRGDQTPSQGNRRRRLWRRMCAEISKQSQSAREKLIYGVLGLNLDVVHPDLPWHDRCWAVLTIHSALVEDLAMHSALRDLGTHAAPAPSREGSMGDDGFDAAMQEAGQDTSRRKGKALCSLVCADVGLTPDQQAEAATLLYQAANAKATALTCTAMHAVEERWACRYEQLQQRVLARRLDTYTPLRDVLACMPRLPDGRLDCRFLFADEHVSFLPFAIHLELFFNPNVEGGPEWKKEWQYLVQTYIDYLIHTQQYDAMRQYCLLLPDDKARVHTYVSFLRGLSADARILHLDSVRLLIRDDGSGGWTQENVVDIAQQMVAEEMTSACVGPEALRIKAHAVIGFVAAARHLGDLYFQDQALADANKMLVQFIVAGGADGRKVARELCEDLLKRGLVTEPQYKDEDRQRLSVAPVSTADVTSLLRALAAHEHFWGRPEGGQGGPGVDPTAAVAAFRGVAGPELMTMPTTGLEAMLKAGGLGGEELQKWVDGVVAVRLSLQTDVVFSALAAYVKVGECFSTWIQHCNCQPAPAPEPAAATSAATPEPPELVELRQEWAVLEEQYFLDAEEKLIGGLQALSEEMLPLDDSDLFKDINSLRQKCVPEMVLLLQRMYLQDGRPDRLEKCMAMADRVASEELQLYRSFSRQHMKAFLAQLRECRLRQLASA